MSLPASDGIAPHLAALTLRLDEARRRRAPTERPAAGSIALGDAYVVQRGLLEACERRGDSLCGYKLAITSEPRLRGLGLEAPLTGFLCEGDRVEACSMPMAELIAPRIEPEVAFVTRHRLSGERCTPWQVLAATAFVAGAFEIIDSRWAPGPFDPLAALADNVSSARHVVGRLTRNPHDLDLSLLGTVVAKNGAFVATGTTASVFEHPAASVALLVRRLATQGLSLEAGSLVLTGGLVEAFAVAEGDRVSARFAGLGDVSVRFA